MNNLAQVTLVKTEAARVTLALRQVGPQGISGSVGSILYFGADDPEAGLGNANDAYFQTTTRGMWTKATGAWVESVRLTGLVDWPEGIYGLPETFPPDAHALDAHTAVSLAALNAKISGSPKIAGDAAATTDAAGLVELATDAETVAGTATDLAVTPAGAAAAVSAATSGLVSGAEMLTAIMIESY